ncbi:MAG: hypothetical protein RSF40_01680 [Oscillospiraceae bacterium]
MSLLNSTQRIVKVGIHYEAYDSRGYFLCSGDTYEECEEDLEED